MYVNVIPACTIPDRIIPSGREREEGERGEEREQVGWNDDNA